ncbi:MAG TPA: hypothetical protein VIX73_23440 [Kofleriaceae bacterium]|jgi:hypothetical protein
MQRGITGPSLRQRFGLVVGLGAAALAGCAANGGDEGLVVLKNVVPTATTGGCSFSSQATETSLVRGALDVRAHTGYLFIAQLESRITALAGQESQRTIFTRGANVDISFSDPNLFSAAELADLNAKNALHFMAPFTAPLSPNGGITDVLFELIPADVALALDAKTTFSSTVAQTSFTVVGDLAGGDVTSQKFQYPVTVVSGGLVNELGACSTVSSSFTPRVGNPCNPGQDGIVDCCTDTNNHQVCPAKGTGM